MLCPKCNKETPDGSLFCCQCGKKLTAPTRKQPRRIKGTGTIRKLPGNRSKPWQAIKNRVSLGTFATKSAAQAALDAVRDVDVTEDYNMTLDQVFSRWKREAYPDLAPKSVEDYETTWKRFAPIKDQPMRKLRTDDVQSLIDEDTEKGLSRSHAEKLKKLYSQCCKWAMREDLINKNYAQFLRLPKAAAPDRPVFSEQHLQVLAAHDEDETVKLIRILLYTGLRIHELFALKVSNVDLANRTIVGGGKTAAGKDRTIPIVPDIAADVAYFAGKATGPELISGYNGQRTVNNWRRRNYYPTLEQLGLPRIKPHGCRYTFATRAVAADVQPEVLQKVMGHAKYSTTTEIYAQEDVSAAARELGKISAKKHNSVTKVKVRRVKKKP